MEPVKLKLSSKANANSSPTHKLLPNPHQQVVHNATKNIDSPNLIRLIRPAAANHFVTLSTLQA